MNDKNNLALPHQSVDYINLLDVAHTIRQGKWLILFFTLISSLLAFIYTYGQSPIYKADTLLRVESQKAGIPGIDDLASLMGTEDTSVGTELELIKSRKNLAITVNKLKLNIIAQPKKVPFFSNLHKRFFSPEETQKPSLIWGKLDTLMHRYSWGNEHIKVSRLNVPNKWLNKPLTLITKQDSSFEIKSGDSSLLKGKVGESSTSIDKSFSIFVSELTGLLGTEFSITKLSMRRATARLKKKITASEKGKKTGIIVLSLTGHDEDKIVKILDDVSKNYVEQNISRSSEEASNALAFLEEQIKPVKENVDKTEASLKQYRIEHHTADLPQETQAILDVIVGIDAKLQKYSLSREELSQKYAKQHPTIQALNFQENKLKRRKQKTQEKIAKLPKKQQVLLKLEREIKVSNAIYIDLLNKIQEFKIAKASTVGNAYIVDLADIDESYVKPNKKRILSIGVLLGLIFGMIVVFLRKALRHTVNNPDKLEEALGLPVYATIPLSKNVKLTGGLNTKVKKQKSLLAEDHKNDPAIESLRSLRTSLHFALHEAKNNIVMITGPSPYIGKSFISSNFAAVIATAKQRVILIDADMRKGYLHELFKQELVPGLSDIITKKATLEDAIQTIPVGDTYIDIITRGQTPPNPSELLMHGYFDKLLDHLSNNYDLVIIDSPPIHAVTDPTIIGGHAGVVFMVVHSDRHSLKEIEHAVARLSQAGVETKGFIFNGYDAKNSAYNYGYQSYYGEYKL